MKLATIGSGSIVDLMFKSIADIDGIDVVAVYSRTMDKARAFADKHHVPKAYDDLDAMFGDPEIDTVYIASPNSLHYPQAKKALEAGKNVILEKPFTPSRRQAEELFELAEKNGVMIFEAITNIHTPNFGLLKDNLSMAGEIREGVFNFSQYSSRYKKYMDFIVENAFNPKMDGGALMDINIYNIHLALALFGMPESVTYFPVLGWNGIDTSGVLMMQYPHMNITCIGSKDSSADYLATLQGEQGTFRIVNGSTGRMNDVFFTPPQREMEKQEDIQISVDQGLHMSYEFMDFLVALNEQNKEMYEACKKQTLMAEDILDQALAQRNALAASRA